jgi:uncharacterized protein (UPF0332 family)
MKPQSTDFLRAAEEALADARAILAAGVPRQAARVAYYAQFHAAHAFIFERTGKIAKTHKGVNTQFHRLAKAEIGLDAELAPDLSAAYHYKEVAGYDAGGLNTITRADAQDAIAGDVQFVSVINRILTPPPATAGP